MIKKKQQRKISRTLKRISSSMGSLKVKVESSYIFTALCKTGTKGVVTRRRLFLKYKDIQARQTLANHQWRYR